MDLWIILSVVAAFMWAVNNVNDKIIVSRLVTNAMLPAIAGAIISFIAGVVILAIRREGLTPNLLAVGLVGGVVYLLASVFYFNAIKKEEASRVVPLFALTMIWTPLGAALFLNEIFTVSIYASMAVIFFGSLLILYRKSHRHGIAWEAFVLMIFSSLGYASSFLIMTYLLQYYSFWTASALTMVGYGITGAVLMHRYRRDMLATSIRAWVAMLGNETLNVIAWLIYVLAISLGFVSLVSAVGSSQYVFIFIFGIVLSFVAPKVLKEDTRGIVIAQKFVATLLIVGGVVWIALNT